MARFRDGKALGALGRFGVKFESSQWLNNQPVGNISFAGKAL
jgi:hypothetical protein